MVPPFLVIEAWWKSDDSGDQKSRVLSAHKHLQVRSDRVLRSDP